MEQSNGRWPGWPAGAAPLFPPEPPQLLMFATAVSNDDDWVMIELGGMVKCNDANDENKDGHDMQMMKSHTGVHLTAYQVTLYRLSSLKVGLGEGLS